MSLSDKKKMLLLRGAKTGGQVTITMAERLYSTKDSGQNAVTSLEFEGFLEKSGVPGVFDIARLPQEVKERYQEQREEE